MFLELAEGNGAYNPPGMYYMSERTRVRGYSRKANRVKSHFRTLSEQAGVEDNPYIFVPDFYGGSKGFMVREDNFDDLDAQDWADFMYQVAPYQPQVQQGMSEGMFLADRASRKAKRAAKQEQKFAKKEAKTAIKNARAEAKIIKAQQGGGGGGFLDKISGALGGVLGGVFGIPQVQPGGAPAGPTDTESWWDTEVMGIPYKYAIPGAVALTATGIYFATRKRRRRK